MRYVGARFEGPRLPTTVLADLTAFRDLLVAYAKDRWRQSHADRERLPKGFDKSISLDLVGIEDGSAVPKLDWSLEQAHTTLPGFTDEIEEIVDQSFKDLVGLIDGAGQDRFPALSSEHIRALNKFGAGLRDQERIEFPDRRDPDGNVVFLDSYRRKALITHVRETYQLMRCMERLTDLGNLQDGWHDGEGSAPSDEAIKMAKTFLRQRPSLAGALSVFPTLAGGVLFEFEVHGWDYSVEIEADGGLEFFGIQIEGPEEAVGPHLILSWREREQGSFSGSRRLPAITP